MEQDEELDDQISRYIHNKMTEQELLLFKAKIESDPIIKKEVEQWQHLKSYYNEDLIELKKNLREAELRYREKNAVSTTNRTNFILGKRKHIWLAAAAIVILVTGIFYFAWNRVDIVQLAKENSLDGLNKASSRKGDSIAVVDILFYSGQYSDYLTKAFSILKENTNSIERSILNINICKSYIQLNQADKAILFYQSLTEEEKEYCYLQYQAALACTIKNNKRVAISLFEMVINKGCFPVDKNAGDWIKRLK